MNHDLLEQLAVAEVPPPPDDFDRRVHQRLNRTLAVGQLVEFVFVAAPLALVEFARTGLAAAIYTLSGRYPTTGKNVQQRGN
ncbi:MAG TPA: hypothetical protein VFI31_23805 [Pirellulales bacterium]|nr:hypothetical protein [Pirellulales bacterium]